MIYEEIAAWDDPHAWAYLGPKGREVRAFAQAELTAKAVAAKKPANDDLKVPGLDSPEPVKAAVATVHDAISDAARYEKKSKSKRMK